LIALALNFTGMAKPLKNKQENKDNNYLHHHAVRITDKAVKFSKLKYNFIPTPKVAHD